MNESFASGGTERLFTAGKARRLPPSNRLEALNGGRVGQWSIRINGQWRVCFCFERGHAQNGGILDYH